MWPLLPQFNPNKYPHLVDEKVLSNRKEGTMQLLEKYKDRPKFYNRMAGEVRIINITDGRRSTATHK